MSFQKPYKPEEYKSLIENNFSEIWFQFLYFEVMRSRDCVRFMRNNPNGYLILQVISWHHGLVLLSENRNQDRKNFVKSWEASARSKRKPNKKLTYSLVSELTGLSIETIRRHVKKLINEKWVSYTKKGGIIYNPNIEKAKEMTESLNPKEIDRFVNLLSNIDKIRFRR
ncbi:hypothetical protein OA253_01745 [Alphaproteobacteria bacterium]|nr:hypothetical protein [Alphaproteobacteria bacterium]